MKYLKQFETQAAYDAAESGLILPNVSLTVDNNTVHYNPWVETRVVAKFNVTDTTSPTRILCIKTCFTNIEIDGVEQPNVVTGYTFTTTGEHTVKYTLSNPTSIKVNAFYQCSGLTSVTIPNSVTNIGESAFQNCTSLTSINIPSGITSINEWVFGYCRSLTRIGPVGSGASVEIPNNVTSIGSSSFRDCSGITSVVIPDSVTSIGDYAFDKCTGLTTCTIGSGVINIGKLAFENCSSLTNIVSNAMTAPTIANNTFNSIKTGGTLTVPSGSSGYDVWMGTGNYYLGKYNWTKVEQ